MVRYQQHIIARRYLTGSFWVGRKHPAPRDCLTWSRTAGTRTVQIRTAGVQTTSCGEHEWRASCGEHEQCRVTISGPDWWSLSPEGWAMLESCPRCRRYRTTLLGRRFTPFETLFILVSADFVSDFRSLTSRNTKSSQTWSNQQGRTQTQLFFFLQCNAYVGMADTMWNSAMIRKS